MFMKVRLSPFLVASFAALVTSCGSDQIAGPPPVSAIVVTSTANTIQAGDSTRAIAIALSETGSAIPGYTVTWSSSDTAIATVTGNGIVRGRAPGSVVISAIGGGHTGSVTIQIRPIPVRSIAISPAAPSVLAGDTVRLAVQALDSAGNALAGREVTWRSDTPSIATVSAAGLVQTIQLGVARIVATVEGVSASTTVTAVPGEVRSITIFPTLQILYAGGSEASTAVGELFVSSSDARFFPIPAGAVTYAWSSEDTTKVVVTPAGVPIGRGATPGVRVFASVGSVRGEASVRVVRVITIDAGDRFGCFLASSGETWCWGTEQQGELGRGRIGAPTAFPNPVAGNLRFNSLSVGANTTCGLTDEGAAWCWGANHAGQLGDSTFVGGRLAPTAVRTSQRFRQISVGRYHTCAITFDGSLYCWGEPVLESPGVSTPRLVDTPIRFRQISAGAFYQCGIDGEGAAWCWGQNEWGQLGNGSTTIGREFVASPARVTGGLTFKQLAASRVVTCGLTTGGKLYCWGREIRSTPNPLAITSPALVDANLTFDSIAVNDTNVCGITSGGKAFCRGALPGNGSFESELMVEVKPPGAASQADYSSIAIGGSFRCVLTVQGLPSCWGSEAASGRTSGTLLTPLPLSRPLLFAQTF